MLLVPVRVALCSARFFDVSLDERAFVVEIVHLRVSGRAGKRERVRACVHSRIPPSPPRTITSYPWDKKDKDLERTISKSRERERERGDPIVFLRFDSRKLFVYRRFFPEEQYRRSLSAVDTRFAVHSFASETINK